MEVGHCIHYLRAIAELTTISARAIQDQLLKDFSVRSEFSDWFSRDEGPKAPVILKPNPRNIELDEKMAQLEANIQRCAFLSIPLLEMPY